MAGRGRGGWPWPLHDVRIAAKLAMILALPILAVLVLAGYAISSTGRQAVQAQQLRALTMLSGEAGDLAYALELERVAAAQALQAGPRQARLGEYVRRAQETDQAVAEYRQRRAEISVPDSVAPVLLSIGRQLDQVDALRAQVEAAGVAMSAALVRYRILVADLLTYRETVAQTAASNVVADQIRAAAALSAAVEFIGQQQTAVLRGIVGDSLTPAAAGEIMASRIGYDDALLTFQRLARPEWRDWFQRTVTGPAVIAVQAMEGSLTRTPVLLEVDAWVTATTAQMDLIRDVLTRVDGAVLGAVTAERDGQMRVTLSASGGVALALVLMIMLALWVARSMARSLVDLREAALVVSRERLPQAVARLTDERSLGTLTPEQVAEQSEDPVEVRGSDEIGQVAAAFNAVHREAVRVAAAQAQLRVSVGALFVSLGRRLQGMIDLLISRLDAIEQHEQDPARLQQLFDVDHLATRMTRYTESLLVLSGTPFARSHPRSVELLEVLRAAISKIERYVRIDIGVVDEGVAVVPYAADHVVHALAELMDNATAYSPPNSPVVVEARRLSDRVVVEVVDAGVGLSDAQRARLNARLASPPPVDPEALRATGLVVVAHIAAWHGLVVHLHKRRGGGTVAEVTLPGTVLEMTGRHRHALPAIGPAPAKIGASAALPAVVPRLLDRPDDRLPLPATVPVPVAAAATATDGWHWSMADAGWGAAATAATPTPAGTTEGGLPRRKPMAQLVPGSVAAPHHAPIRRDPSAVAAAMSIYRRGLETARAQTREPQ